MGQHRDLPAQRVVAWQVAGAQVLGQAQVVDGVRDPAAFALQRAEAGQHLDSGRGGVAVHPAEVGPSLRQAGAGGGAVAGRVLGRGQVGLGGQHPLRVGTVQIDQLEDQIVIQLRRPAVVAHPLQHRRVDRGRGERAFVVRSVQAFLGRLGESGPQARGMRVAQGDQDARVQRRGDGQVGGGALRVGGVDRIEDMGENGPGTEEIAGGRQRLRLGGQFRERWGHVPHSVCLATLGTSPAPHC